MRSDKKVEAVVLMRIAEGLNEFTLILLVLITWIIAIPFVIYNLHLPEEFLNSMLISSQIAAAAGTIILAIVTAESVRAMREALKVEKLRESFKAIAKELHRARKYVEDDLGRIEVFLNAIKNMPLRAPKLWRLAEIPLGSGGISIDVIRKDFKLHYRKGLKIHDYINSCNERIRKYNSEYDALIASLRSLVVEKLKDKGIGVNPNGLTYVCAAPIDDEWRILFVSPEECQKLSACRVLGVDDHVAAVLVSLDEVLGVRKSEEELSKELTDLYRKIRSEIISSNEFGRYLNDLRNIAENEVKPCLDKLGKKLDKVIDDILERYALSEQEVAAKEGLV